MLTRDISADDTTTDHLHVIISHCVNTSADRLAGNLGHLAHLMQGCNRTEQSHAYSHPCFRPPVTSPHRYWPIDINPHRRVMLFKCDPFRKFVEQQQQLIANNVIILLLNLRRILPDDGIAARGIIYYGNFAHWTICPSLHLSVCLSHLRTV